MAQATQFGAFVPTTQVWDVARFYQVDVESREFKELLVRMYQQINLIATVLNVKESGMYPLQEFVTSMQWFEDPALNSSTAQQPELRQVIRKVIDFGTLPNAAGTKSVPHGLTITGATRFTHIYATASDPTTPSFIPIPYASSILADNIELSVDAMNVNITVGKNRSTYTTTYVVLEFIS